MSNYKGLPLVDADEDLEIEIKEGDIATASRKNPSKCAAANAIKRIYKTDVEVHISRIYVKKKNKWIRYFTPERVAREITSFDRASSFEPGEYTFKAPTKTQKLGAYNYGEHGDRKNKRKKPHRITMNIREKAKDITWSNKK